MFRKIEFVFIILGQDLETVEVAGDSEFHKLVNLKPNTDYLATVIALYEGETEGPAATTRFTIGINKHIHTYTYTQ